MGADVAFTKLTAALLGGARLMRYFPEMIPPRVCNSISTALLRDVNSARAGTISSNLHAPDCRSYRELMPTALREFATLQRHVNFPLLRFHLELAALSELPISMGSRVPMSVDCFDCCCSKS